MSTKNFYEAEQTFVDGIEEFHPSISVKKEIAWTIVLSGILSFIIFSLVSPYMDVDEGLSVWILVPLVAEFCYGVFTARLAGTERDFFSSVVLSAATVIFIVCFFVIV